MGKTQTIQATSKKIKFTKLSGGMLAVIGGGLVFAGIQQGYFCLLLALLFSLAQEPLHGGFMGDYHAVK